MSWRARSASLISRLVVGAPAAAVGGADGHGRDRVLDAPRYVMEKAARAQTDEHHAKRALGFSTDSVSPPREDARSSRPEKTPAETTTRRALRP